MDDETHEPNENRSDHDTAMSTGSPERDEPARSVPLLTEWTLRDTFDARLFSRSNAGRTVANTLDDFVFSLDDGIHVGADLVIDHR